MLELGRGMTRISTVTGKAEHVGAGAAQWVDVVVGAWGGLFSWPKIREEKRCQMRQREPGCTEM